MAGTARTRWAATGAAIAVGLGAGGLGLAHATSPSDAAVFVSITPCRVFDTRPNFNVGPKTSPLGPGETFTVAGHGTTGDCDIPTTATGLVLNLTAVNPTLATFLTVWGDGARPDASALNPTPGQPPTPNAVTTDLTSTGEFNVYNLAGEVHAIADVVGYYTDHDHDERYYTKSQIDAADDLDKFLSIDVYSDPGLNFDDRYANLADDGVGGINLDVDFNFTMPPDYTPGGDVELRLVAYARSGTAFPCQGQLSANWIGVSRAGATKPGFGTGGPNGDLLPADIDRVFGEERDVQEYIFHPGPDVELQPLDAVGFGVYHLGPFPRCDLIISGVSVLYE